MFANDSYSIVGFVKNLKTKEGIAGVRINILGTNTGTYSSMRGFFKLPFIEGIQKIKVSSVGYKSKIIEVNNQIDTILIELEPVSIKMKEATVIGDIEANEVIKRAIARKNENQEAIRTFKALLYSKLVMELDGSVFGQSEGNSFTISGTIGDTAPDKYKMFLMETFSRIYRDYDKNVSFSEIIQRRQTSNITPQNNLLTIGNILDFSTETVNIINTSFVSPLSNDAFDYYNFSIIEKEILDDKYIYVLSVRPKTDVYPLFIGVIKITEGDYQLIEIDLEPSESTKIAFVDSLHFVQRFEKGIEGLWVPRMFELTGKANVDVIKGLMDIRLDLKATSIYSDVAINIDLPDSIYSDNIKKLSVSKTADSIDNDFWDKNSLREITEKEKMMYSKVDSLMSRDSSSDENKDFNYDIFSPNIDFNRVSSITPEIANDLRYKTFILKNSLAYSFGLQKLLGSIGAIFNYDDLSLSANLSYSVSETGIKRIFPRILNTVFAALFHYDYYDYYYKESYDINVNYNKIWLNVGANYVESRDYSLSKSTNRSIFSNVKWRENVEIDDGYYRLLMSSLILNIDYIFQFGNNYNIDLIANYLIGKEIKDNKGFSNYKITVDFEFPTFFTGYSPMQFEVIFTYANLKDVPLQYCERINGSLMFIKSLGLFGTIPLSLYEKDELIIFNARYNLTDLWWRWIGLPTYEGRGLDLVLTASTGRFKSVFGNEWYSELGFALERIPTFFSNVIYFEVGFDWGVGNIASKKFGGYLNLNLPF